MKEEPPAPEDRSAAADRNGDGQDRARAPITGPQAHIGIDIRNGVQLAIEDANAAGVEIGGKKVKFELVAEDDEANPTKATTVAQKLVDAKVVAVVGHFNSGASIPASKIYSDAGIPQISPSSTNPEIHAAGIQDHVPRRRQRRSAGSGRRQIRAGKTRSRKPSPSSTTAPHTARGSPTHSKGRSKQAARKSSRASTPPTRTPISRRS